MDLSVHHYTTITINPPLTANSQLINFGFHQWGAWRERNHNKGVENNQGLKTHV